MGLLAHFMVPSMSIRLETSKKTGIKNYQDFDISAQNKLWCGSLPKKHPLAQFRTLESPLYNCHGLTFASRRTKIVDDWAIKQILQDDAYQEIMISGVLAGDVVLYLGNSGDPNHSGIVVEVPRLAAYPIICSKWGFAGEVVHSLTDVPLMYGPRHKFYRCRL